VKLFGLTILRTKSAQDAVPVPSRSNSLWGIIREPFTGAWQRNIECESTQNILAFSTVYALLALISGDIAKLRIKLIQLLPSGLTTEILANSPWLPVLRKPNKYQTLIQFLCAWIVSKLIHGNTYVLKERNDQRGIVTALHVLDPRLVTPMVTPEGEVLYRVGIDWLAGMEKEGPTVPASEIIHDRMMCLWHPLIGVPPIYACAASTTQGIRIQNNSAKFFENMSRPGGVLTAPAAISDENAQRLKQYFEDNFSGANVGKLLVLGDGLHYEAMTIPAEQAQLIEQLKWTGEDCCRPFLVPGYKLGFGQPTVNNAAQLNQEYYSQALQIHIESIERLLDEGLELPSDQGTELDLDGLLRMDPQTTADVQGTLMERGLLKVDEGRLKLNLPPVTGGDTPYLQQQNFSLAALAKRDAQPNPFAAATSAPAAQAAQPQTEPAPSKSYKSFMRSLKRQFEEADIA